MGFRLSQFVPVGALLSMLSLQAGAQERLPIIDMHLHARKAGYIPQAAALRTPNRCRPHR